VDTEEHSEMVEKQLDAMIVRRARKGEVDPDEQEDAWPNRGDTERLGGRKERREATQKPVQGSPGRQARSPGERCEATQAGETAGLDKEE
jgi:hypothetical protein